MIVMKVNALLFTLVMYCSATQPHEERCSHINYHTLEYDCSATAFCRKTFNISYITMLPYSPTWGVQEFIRICCNNCTKFRVDRVFKNVSELTPQGTFSVKKSRQKSD